MEPFLLVDVPTQKLVAFPANTSNFGTDRFVIKSGAMKARLDEKVGKLRSQIMSFANDGIQVNPNLLRNEHANDTNHGELFFS